MLRSPTTQEQQTFIILKTYIYIYKAKRTFAEKHEKQILPINILLYCR